MVFTNKQYICKKNLIMSLLVIGTVAFDAIETPFGKTDKIVGGGSFIHKPCSFLFLQ